MTERIYKTLEEQRAYALGWYAASMQDPREPVHRSRALHAAWEAGWLDVFLAADAGRETK